MNAKQVLAAAAKRLETKGWIQGNYALMAEAVEATADGKRRVPAGSACGAGGNLVGTPVGETDVIGALRQCGLRYPDVVDEAKEILRRSLGVDNLADWNDEDGRTKEQVIAALQKAARSS